MNLHLAVRNTPERAQDALRTTLQDHFKAELAMPTATNRSRVLAGIHRAIEAVRPGATGVMLQEATKPDAWLGLQPTHGHGSAPGRRVGSWEDTAGHDLDAGGGLDPFVIEVQEMRKAQHATYEAEINKIRDDARKRILDKS